MRILGLDPGLANLGYAVVELRAKHSDDRVVEIGVISTTRATRKRRLLEAEDICQRGRALAERLDRLAFLPTPVAAVCAEAMTWPRHSTAAAKLALAWGVVVATAEYLRAPLIQASPQEIKKACCGKCNASKEEVQDAMEAFYTTKSITLPRSKREHAYDALAAVFAAEKSDTMRTLRAFCTRQGGSVAEREMR